MLILASAFFLSGCEVEELDDSEDLDDRDFMDDKEDDVMEIEECAVGGCSSQVCTTKEKAEDLVTTCEWREKYACVKLTNCGFYNGECQWEETIEYLECLEEVR